MKRFLITFALLGAFCLSYTEAGAQDMKWNQKDESERMAQIESNRLRREGSVIPVSEASEIYITDIVINDKVAARMNLSYDYFNEKYRQSMAEQMNLRFEIAKVPTKFLLDGEADITMTVHLVDADADGEVYGYVVYKNKGEDFLYVYLNGNGGFGQGFDTKALNGVKNVVNKHCINLLRKF